LRELLRYWKTNAVNGYQLSVNGGTASGYGVPASAGGGSYGAGSILNLNANPPAPGQAFSQWIGATVADPTSPTTLFVLPGSNITVTATFTNLPPPRITSLQNPGTGQLQIQSAGHANEAYVLQSSLDLVTWSNLTTNNADAFGGYLWTVPMDPASSQRFF